MKKKKDKDYLNYTKEKEKDYKIAFVSPVTKIMTITSYTNNH